jgi:hypothetical protein
MQQNIPPRRIRQPLWRIHKLVAGQSGYEVAQFDLSMDSRAFHRRLHKPTRNKSEGKRDSPYRAKFERYQSFRREVQM